MIFGSVCEMYCTKKITPGKNFSFSLHEQDQGALQAIQGAVGTKSGPPGPSSDLLSPQKGLSGPKRALLEPP